MVDLDCAWQSVGVLALRSGRSSGGEYSKTLNEFSLLVTDQNSLSISTKENRKFITVGPVRVTVGPRSGPTTTDRRSRLSG